MDFRSSYRLGVGLIWWLLDRGSGFWYCGHVDALDWWVVLGWFGLDFDCLSSVLFWVWNCGFYGGII